MFIYANILKSETRLIGSEISINNQRNYDTHFFITIKCIRILRIK